MSNCILCTEELKPGEGELIWRGDDCRVILVNDPDLPGFCRVIWNRHVSEMTDLTYGEREQLEGIALVNDTSAKIALITSSPNKMTYHYSGTGNQLAVFSAIYYPKGWNAYIDGKMVAHFQANFVLRSMLLPKGNYDIEFKFEPESFITGQKISEWCSLILLLLIIGLLTKRFLHTEKKHVKSVDK